MAQHRKQQRAKSNLAHACGAGDPEGVCPAMSAFLLLRGRRAPQAAGSGSRAETPGFRRRNRWRLLWGERLGRPECPYLRRWALETPWGSLRLHHWRSGDDPRALHDHPWAFWTLVLSGSYCDVTPAGREWLRPGTLRFRPALHRHTVEVAPGGCWTFLWTGPHERFWGFWTPRAGGERFRKSNRYFLEEGEHPCQ